MVCIFPKDFSCLRMVCLFLKGFSCLSMVFLFARNNVLAWEGFFFTKKLHFLFLKYEIKLLIQHNKCVNLAKLVLSIWTAKTILLFQQKTDSVIQQNPIFLKCYFSTNTIIFEKFKKTMYVYLNTNFTF